MTTRTGLAAALLAAGLALAPDAGFAHATKETTVPSDGAALAGPPPVIAMEFDAPMRITVISLRSADGAAIDFEAVAGPAATTRYEARPPALAPGRYSVEWRGLADDGHPMRGSFGFTVK